MSQTIDDRLLWRLFRQGSQAAFARIYQQEVKDLYAYGWKICYDRDVVQDCIHDLFCYIWEHREGLGETDNIRRYLCTALRRNIVTQLKSVPAVEHPSEHPHVPAYDSVWIAQQTAYDNAQRLSLAFGALPSRQREAVRLTYFQNLSSAEVAVVMNIHRRAVYKLLAKAINNLRNLWSAKAGESIELHTYSI
jgi:RNA polymerase sigma factor (sigma-70 family)